MKKVFALAAMSVFVLSACKKDFTCECSASGFSQSEVYKDVKKKDAEDKCDKKQSDLQVVNSSITCSVK